VLGLTGLDYCEADRQMLDSEVLIGRSGMAVYKDTTQKCNMPYDKVSVTDLDRNQILNNIHDAFSFQGIEIDVL
jgi:hypothetical protein